MGLQKRPFALATLLLLLSTAALPACGPDESEEASDEDELAIVGGRNDLGTPSVGYLVEGSMADVNTLPICTGTLVAANAVLLAAHCVPDCPGGYAFGFGAVGSRPLNRVAQVIRNPGYRPGLDLQNDIALLVLARPVTGVAPARPVTAATTLRKTCDYRAYGYGFTTEDAIGGRGERRSVQECFVGWRGHAGIVVHRRGHSVCNGDSGGPLMQARTANVLGVLSESDSGGPGSSCAVGLDARYTSVAAHAAFVHEALARAARALCPAGEALRLCARVRARLHVDAGQRRLHVSHGLAALRTAACGEESRPGRASRSAGGSPAVRLRVLFEPAPSRFSVLYRCKFAAHILLP